MNKKEAIAFFEERGYARTSSLRADRFAPCNMQTSDFNANLRFGKRGQRGRPLVFVFLCIYPIFDAKRKVRPVGLLAREFREAKALSAQLPADVTVQCGGVSTARFCAGKCLTCGDTPARCPGVHTFEEIQQAGRRASCITAKKED